MNKNLIKVLASALIFTCVVAPVTTITTTTIAQARSTYAVVSGDGVRLRERASTSSRILIEEVPDGTELKIYATKSGWSQVTYGGETGWISNQFLRFS